MTPPMESRSRSERASVSVQPSPPFDVDAILRRFSTPSPYTGLNSATRQPTMSPMEGPSSQEHRAVPSSETPFDATAHKYILTSRGRDYATIVVMSRAHSIQDTPLLHLGDELKGLIVLPRSNLSDMQAMEVVFQLFESDPIRPSYETKRILMSQQVDESCISGGQFIWPFAITPPPVLSSNPAESSLGHLSPRGHSIGPRVQLIVAISRRGRLTRNVGLKQPINYIRPDPVGLTSSPSMLSTELPSSNSGESRGLSVDSSWPEQKFPRVIIRGVMFGGTYGQVPIEVECKLTVPASYPVSYIIPLRLVMTSETREALDLLSVSDAIDVRLLKVLAFGENAATGHPLRNRYNRTDWAGKAQWEAHSRSWELPPSEGQSRARWRIKLNGQLHRDQNVRMEESFERPGMALMYFVCLFPFSSPNFRPATDPNKELCMGKLPITRQH